MKAETARGRAAVAALLLLAACAGACEGCGADREIPPIPEPEVPALRTPASHVAVPTAVPPRIRQRPTPPKVQWPERATPPVAVAAPEPPDPVAEPAAEPPAAAHPEPAAAKPAGGPETEALAWLLAANDLEPGCLLTGQIPRIALPSPEGLAWLLRAQPRDFAGVAREAVVCLLNLPRLTGGEVYGASAFRPFTRTSRAALDGSGSTLGVFVTPIVVTEPPSEGTLYLAMDERAGRWSVRASLYVPWVGDARSRRFVSLRSMSLFKSSRRAVVLRQRDRHRTTDHYVALHETQQLQEALALTVSATPADGPAVKARAHVAGRGWPRRIVYKAIEQPPGDGAPGRWAISTWEAERGRAYVRQDHRAGTLDVAGARQLLTEGHPIDADWVIAGLPRATRQTSAAIQVRAEGQAARRRHRKALRFWRQAVKAPDAPPEAHRDYGLYLLGRGKRRRAVRPLARYLELAPDAPDRTEIEARLDEARGR